MKLKKLFKKAGKLVAIASIAEIIRRKLKRWKRD